MNIQKFADHLFEQGDYFRASGEYQRLYFSDSARYGEYASFRQALCAWRLQRPQEVVWRLNRRYSSEGLTDSALILSQVSRFATQPESELLPLVTDSEWLKREFRILYLIHAITNDSLEVAERELKDTTTMLDPRGGLIADFVRAHAHSASKSVAVAGVLSAAVPGSGKMYAGRVADGLYSLVLVAGCTWLAYDGFSRGGRTSAKGIAFGSLGSFFYVGNVYGSIVAVKADRRFFRQKVHDTFLVRLQYWFPF